MKGPPRRSRGFCKLWRGQGSAAQRATRRALHALQSPGVVLLGPRRRAIATPATSAGSIGAPFISIQACANNGAAWRGCTPITTSAVGARAATASARLRHEPWRPSERAARRASSGVWSVRNQLPTLTMTA